MSKFKSLLCDERGASMVEYSILIGLITAALLVVISSVAGKILTKWQALDGAL